MRRIAASVSVYDHDRDGDPRYRVDFVVNPLRKDERIRWYGYAYDLSDDTRRTNLAVYGVLEVYGEHSDIVARVKAGEWQAVLDVAEELLEVVRVRDNERLRLLRREQAAAL